MNKQELIERIEDFPCEASLVTEMIRINKNTLLGWVKELDEPQKVTVPQFVANYINYAIENDWDFQDLFECIEDEEDEELLRWVYHERNQETLATAWLNGYKVEKEKRYLVKIIGIINYNSYLNYHKVENKWTIESRMETDAIRTKHTRKELEKANFGWVFNCPGVEIEEVE